MKKKKYKLYYEAGGTLGTGLISMGTDIGANMIEQSQDSPNLAASTGAGALRGAGQGAALGTAIMPGVGTAIGAGAGALIGGAAGFIKGRNEQKALNAQEEAELRMRAGNAVNSGVRTSQSNIGQMFMYGGKLQYQNGGELTRYEGNTHEMGGIALGNTNAEVEGGETRIKDNIFSDNVKYNKNLTFADYSKKIDDKYSLRPNDSFSKQSKKLELDELFEQQEQLKMATDRGSKLEYKNGGVYISKPKERAWFKDGGVIEGEYESDNLSESEIKHLKSLGYSVNYI